MSTDGSMGVFRVNSSIDSSLQAEQKQPLANNTDEPSNPNVNNKIEESIESFKQKYEQILYSKVLKEIEPYEDERKKRFKIALIVSGLLSILGILIFLFLDVRGSGDIATLCLGGAGAFWYWIKKEFENKIKLKIMPKLMQAFPEFYWQKTPPISDEEIKSIKIFPNISLVNPKFDDSFLGTYRGVEISIAECNYSYNNGRNKKTIFNGVIIRLKMNKNFDGITIVRPKSQTDKDMKKLEKINLEDPEFEKKFKTFSTDQIESRYLLTTAFMQRLKDINFAFNSSESYCVFFSKYVYIAPYFSGDLFNLFSLRKPVTDTEQFDIMFKQIISILQLVDHFKLDKRLGL